MPLLLKAKCSSWYCMAQQNEKSNTHPSKALVCSWLCYETWIRTSVLQPGFGSTLSGTLWHQDYICISIKSCQGTYLRYLGSVIYIVQMFNFRNGSWHDSGSCLNTVLLSNSQLLFRCKHRQSTVPRRQCACCQYILKGKRIKCCGNTQYSVHWPPTQRHKV